MPINFDILYSIFKYIGPNPVYKRICKDMVEISAILRKEQRERMSRMYPYWDRVSTGKGCLPLQEKYSIPIYQLNNAALDSDWDVFLEIVQCHGYMIAPASLLICHMFNRFDISDKIIRLYTFEKLISLVNKSGGNYSRGIYTWMGGIYRYPLLYNMYRLGYKDKNTYMKWVTSPSAGWKHCVIGFIHPDMKGYGNTHHYIEYMGSIKTFPQVYCENQGEGYDDICHPIRRFVSWTCVTPDMISFFPKLINIYKHSKFYLCSIHPYWIGKYSKFISSNTFELQGNRMDSVQNDTSLPSAIRLAIKQSLGENITDDILIISWSEDNSP